MAGIPRALASILGPPRESPRAPGTRVPESGVNQHGKCPGYRHRKRPGSAAAPKRGAERRGRITRPIAHTRRHGAKSRPPAIRVAIERAPPPISGLDPPAPRHRVVLRKPETGDPSPSGGRVRALQAILRPWIPPNRPTTAQNRRESGFPGSRGRRPPVGDRQPKSARGTSRLSPVTISPRLADRAGITSGGSSAHGGAPRPAAPADWGPIDYTRTGPLTKR